MKGKNCHPATKDMAFATVFSRNAGRRPQFTVNQRDFGRVGVPVHATTSAKGDSVDREKHVFGGADYMLRLLRLVITISCTQSPLQFLA